MVNGLRICMVLLVMVIAPSIGISATTLTELRAELRNHIGDSLTTAVAEDFARQAFELADQATSRSGFWNAMTLVADVCKSAPTDAAHQLRARALEKLAANFSDTMRWSSLITRQFRPQFENLSPDVWQQELDAYDGTLDRVRHAANDEHVRAELLYAKALMRIHINRHWDWLTAETRKHTLAILDTLANRFGDLSCPGNPSHTQRNRAVDDQYELKTLYFGAPAPKTAGTDLAGLPIDIDDYRGQIVILDFWTSFCKPCLAMVPGVLELLDELEGQPVVYIGVNGDQTQEQGLATAERVGMTWRNLWDGPTGPDGPLAQTWRVSGWPTVVVLDAEGRIRSKLIGGSRIDRELKRVLTDLITEIGK